MELETLQLQRSLSEMKMLINSSVLTFDLPDLINSLKQSPEWVNGELNAKILLNSPEKQIILTALHEKTEINSFQSKESITIQIIEGEMLYHSNKDSMILNTGQLLTLRDNIKYRLTSLEESVFLLTISNHITKENN
jgi:quercetin dioxygenase-like cupin family protein